MQSCPVNFTTQRSFTQRDHLIVIARYWNLLETVNWSVTFWARHWIISFQNEYDIRSNHAKPYLETSGSVSTTTRGENCSCNLRQPSRNPQRYSCSPIRPYVDPTALCSPHIRRAKEWAIWRVFGKAFGKEEGARLRANPQRRQSPCKFPKLTVFFDIGVKFSRKVQETFSRQ